VSTPSKTDPFHPQAKKGIQYFNQGNYFKAHESLEEAWMKSDPPERDLYQGILQIGLAYYQITRNNYRGALKMFRRGQRILAHLEESLLGVDVGQLRIDARAVEEELCRLGPDAVQQLDKSLFRPVPTILKPFP